MLARVVVFVLMSAALPLAAAAQAPDAPEGFGLGAQVGRPSGVSLRWYYAPERSFDLVVSLNVNDHLIFHPHLSFKHPIPDTPTRFYIGPGVTVGRLVDGPEEGVQFGLSSVAGLDFLIDRIEIYVQAMPQVRFLPKRNWKLGGAVGFRYFF